MGQEQLSEGQLRRHVALGSEAVYRVIAHQGQLVVVDVVSAPKLAAGTRLRLTAAAIRRMEVVAAPTVRHPTPPA